MADTTKQALQLLQKLEDQINSNSRIASNEKDSAKEAIKIFRTNISKLSDSRKGPSEDQIEGIAGFIEALTSITDNFENFTSGDAISIAIGAVNIVGAIGGVVAGPYGPLVAAGCGLISSILSLFGGGGPSLTDQIDAIIRAALEDFKDEAIYESVIGSLRDIKAMITQLIGIAQYNGGKVGDNETSFLTDTSFSLVANDVLGVLEGQLSRHKTDTDSTKCSRLATYTFYYSNICLMKTILLNIHCGLLRRNELNGTFAGASKFLTEGMPNEDRKVLGFLEEIPEPGSSNGCWWMLYRHLHNSLDVLQRSTIVGYCTKVIGLNNVFPGKLVCIYNKQHETYNYAASGNAAEDDDRRNVFRWTPGTAGNDSLWRIIDKGNGNYAIFTAYYGEYLYASEKERNSKRRYCWTWRPGGMSGHDESLWKISGDDWESDCTIKNVGKNEYYYGSADNYNSERAYPFCWIPGNVAGDGRWKLINISYTDTLDLNKPRN